jgi:thioredoxin reductase (NADPH)
MGDEIRNLIIIGSGPAGYTSAIYAARASLSPLVLEGSVTAGGALMNTTEVENYPGFPEGIQGPDLMDKFRAQAERFGAELVTDDATSVSLDGPVKSVTDGSGNTWRARSLILATGSGYRRIGIPDEDRLSGHGVSWCATCDGFFFRNQDVAVVGGGDSAMEEATFLSRFASSVTVIHRRDQLRASAIMADRAMANPKIRFAWNSVVTEINCASKVESVGLTDTVTGVKRTIAVTGVFVAIGHDPRSELFADQVDLDPGRYVQVSGRTSAVLRDGQVVPGVFAAGDLVDHSYRQAITAAGSGCAAALDAERYLSQLS